MKINFTGCIGNLMLLLCTQILLEIQKIKITLSDGDFYNNNGLSSLGYKNKKRPTFL